MKLELTEGSWRLVVQRDHSPAQFAEAGRIQAATTSHPDAAATATRSLVELRGSRGGLQPTALVGGEFLPHAEQRLLVDVAHSGDLGLGATPTCPSLIGSLSLVAGLPLEFAEAVVKGVVSGSESGLLSGQLTIDRGAHDEVESSPYAFQLAAVVLVLALTAAAHQHEPDEEKLRQALRNAG